MSITSIVRRHRTRVVVAALAIVVAGTGVVAAAVTGSGVVNESLTGLDVKNSSLFSSDIKDGGLLGIDLKADTITGREVSERTLLVPANISQTLTATDVDVGYEIDLMDEVADRIGTEATYEKTIFDNIIPALDAKKCDAIISSMNVTPEREKQVDFVEYMEIGQSLMVPTGDEDKVSSLEDLAGMSVAVQSGTTLGDALKKQSKELEDAGKDPIDVQTFPDAGAAANALKTDKVDVFFADSPIVAEYVNKDEDAFAFAGEPIDPLPVGIAIRKGDSELLDAVQEAVDSMYEDGTMEEILSDWNVQDFMLADEGGEEDGASS